MTAGNLRYRLGFFQRENVSDGYGNTQADYPDEPDFEEWAQGIPRLGGETVIAARLTGAQPVTFRVRQTPDTVTVNTEDWKLRDMATGLDYNIRSIVDPLSGTREHGKWLDILVQSGVVT